VRRQTRVLLVDLNFRVIAASDGQGLLTERIPLSLMYAQRFITTARALVAFHATPGYETHVSASFGVIPGSAARNRIAPFARGIPMT
jgi:hypothetical protein